MSILNFPLKAYYVWSGEIKAKILARTEFEAAKLVFERFADNKTCDPYCVNVGLKGFEGETARFDVGRILKAAGYTK